MSRVSGLLQDHPKVQRKCSLPRRCVQNSAIGFGDGIAHFPGRRLHRDPLYAAIPRSSCSMRMDKTKPPCLRVAREFSHAEVAFVFAANAADHDVRLRFFNCAQGSALRGSRDGGRPRGTAGLGKAHAGRLPPTLRHSASSRSARKSNSEPRARSRSSNFARPHRNLKRRCHSRPRCGLPRP